MVVYALSLVALYGVSAAYHLLPMSEGARSWMRRADHATIYLVIAGAFGPFCLLVVGGTEGRVLLYLVWAGAAAGVGLKLARFERSHAATGTLYVVLGWLAAVALPTALRRLDTADIVLMFTVGVLYTAGTVVLVTRWPDPFPDVFGYHEVWHAMVVAASACYFAVVWSIV